MDLNQIWVTVFSLIKKITGDVDVEGKGTLQDQINDCFTSASEGKAKVASALTGKGVPTKSDATYDTMAANIDSIKTNPNLQSKSTTLKTAAQTITPDSGYDGLSDVTVPAVTGTAAVGNVLTGKTFNSATAGIAKTGTMANKGGTTVTTTTTSEDDDYTYLSIPEEGYYNTSSKVRILTDSLNGSTPQLLDEYNNTTNGATTDTTIEYHSYAVPQKGTYLIVAFANGNSGASNIYINDNEKFTGQLTQNNGTGGSTTFYFGRLNKDDIVKIYTHNSGGSGYCRRYRIYKIG